MCCIQAQAPIKAAMKRQEAEFDLQRQRKFEEASSLVMKLELEINSLEAQRFIHIAEKDMETVAEIDEVWMNPHLTDQKPLELFICGLIFEIVCLNVTPPV